MAETNYEHYKDEIIKHCIINRQCTFFKKYILNSDSCSAYDCDYCKKRILNWFDEPYEEPVIEIDWSKVPVDTPVIVEEGYNAKQKRYFCKYENDKIFTFDVGTTSWSCPNTKSPNWITAWNTTQVTLAREEDIEKYKKVIK